MSNYEDRRADRVERLGNRAAKLARGSDRAYSEAEAAIRGIPPGQPILVGHHSERRHRNAIDRHDRKMRKAIELDDAAKRAAALAESSVRRSAIDSDDPDAAEKIRAKIAAVESGRASMKALNAVWRACGRPSPDDIAGWGRVADHIASESPGGPAGIDIERVRLEMLVRCKYGQGHQPFESYAIASVGAEARRLKRRLVGVGALPREGRDPASETKYGRVVVEHDPDAGRVLVRTPKKNADATELMRRHGFNWSRARGCWSRKLTANAIAVCEHTIGPGLERIYGE